MLNLTILAFTFGRRALMSRIRSTDDNFMQRQSEHQMKKRQILLRKKTKIKTKLIIFECRYKIISGLLLNNFLAFIFKLLREHIPTTFCFTFLHIIILNKLGFLY